MTLTPRYRATLLRVLGFLLTVFALMVALIQPAPDLFWPALSAAWVACAVAAAWLWHDGDRDGAQAFLTAVLLAPLLLAAYWFALRLIEHL